MTLAATPEPLSTVDVLEVFADVACPFTHVGLRRFVSTRASLGRDKPVLRVRAWPLELVNGEAVRGPDVAPKIGALRDTVAPDCFTTFNPEAFPTSTRPALASSAAAYRLGPERGEQFSLAIRDALFEGGRDISDPKVLAELRLALGVGNPTDADAASVDADFREGTRRGVVGSPHFFTADGEFFCPSLEIEKVNGALSISFDENGFRTFIAATLA